MSMMRMNGNRRKPELSTSPRLLAFIVADFPLPGRARYSSFQVPCSLEPGW